MGFVGSIRVGVGVGFNARVGLIDDGMRMKTKLELSTGLYRGRG